METHTSRLLVCIRQYSCISVHPVALVHEAVHLVPISLASEQDRTESHTHTPGSVWRLEFHRKKFLCVRSNSLRPGSHPCWHRGWPCSLWWRSASVVQAPDRRFYHFLRRRHARAVIDVYSPPGARQEKRAGGIRFAGSALRRRFRSEMGP